ncbi:helix-turn-helix domain-containing protein [Ktedonospora formicarum]|uniref:HTH cro/C1-type domain-containing protein n=1 Tax=Ktedonospora formicarum TaxID=2778364 RepID=A0A8J3HY77_9CHLR|nr:helix-turn-helix transcriptional regulator [Ktedonospora formicarum]GHO45929.1 hypothetical protein KSX_40920 [Ktedonospora formicarum]
MDDLFPPFGDLLKNFRKRSKITQQALAIRLGIHRNTIGFWERGDILPDSKARVLELADTLSLNKVETLQLLEASMTSIIPYWYQPFPKNPFFIGREDVLRTLHDHMITSKDTSTSIYALQGVGGIGKTQIAIEYAYRYSFEYTALLWVDAETLETVLDSFQHIAGVLQLPGRQETEPQQIFEKVYHWLSSHTQWLLIWDHIDTPELLLRFLPPMRQGHILLTTRNHIFGPIAHRISLRPMTQEEGVLFLLQRTRTLDAQSPPLSIHQIAESMPTENAVVKDIVRQMGGLPLALDQVGAYIEETGCRFLDYVRHYRQHPIRLLDRRGTSGGAHPLAVAAMFLLAYEQVRQEMPMAADILCVLAVSHTVVIPEDFFLMGAIYLGPILGTLATEPFQFDLAITVLRRLSLVQRHTYKRVLSFPPLLQVVLYEHMSKQERSLWQSRIASKHNAIGA